MKSPAPSTSAALLTLPAPSPVSRAGTSTSTTGTGTALGTGNTGTASGTVTSCASTAGFGSAPRIGAATPSGFQWPGATVAAPAAPCARWEAGVYGSNKRQCTYYFNAEWEESCCFIDNKGKCVCLLCGGTVAALKKHNVERHLQTNHGSFDISHPLKSELREV